MRDLEAMLEGWQNYLALNPDTRGPHELPDFRCGVQACADQLAEALARLRDGA